MKTALFWIGVVLTVVVPAPLAIYLGSADISGIFFASGFVAVLFSKIELLEELSVGPLKAKLRATLNEAAATVEQLRSIGVELSSAVLSMMIGSEVASDVGLKAKIDLHKRIVKCLSELGVSQEQQEAAQSDWRIGISWLYIRLMRSIVEGRELFDRPNRNASEAQQAASAELLDMAPLGSTQMPPPVKVREVFARHSIKNAELNLWVDDYEKFYNTLTIPRVEEFLKNRCR